MRHGRTAGNTSRLLHGSTDLPLDDIGKRQAELTGHRLRDDCRYDAVLSSPLLRARMTSAAIAGDKQIPVRLIPALREIDFGDYENLPFDEMLSRHPELMPEQEIDIPVDFSWPNGDDLAGFYQRTLETFAQLHRDWAGASVVVVTHNGFLGSLFSQLNGHSPYKWQAYRFGNCSITSVVATEASINVIQMNDVDHLRSLEASQ